MAPVSASWTTLAGLMQAHVCAVPFENLDVLLGRPIDLSIDAVADKIRSVLREGITLGGRLLHTEASIGVAIYPDDGAHAEALLKHADGGMYREKMG